MDELYLCKNALYFMAVKPPTEKDHLQVKADIQINEAVSEERVLCFHCKRTAKNGIKCKGICVSDNEY